MTVSPESPTTEESITFTATVTDDEGLSSVELTIIFQSDTTSHTMNQGDGDQFSVTINPLEQSGSLIYYVVAADITGLSETTNLFSLTISVPPEPPQELTIADLLINIDDYIGVEFTYYLNETNLFSIFLGSQKGGLVCANGTCVMQPNFINGVKFTGRVLF